MERLFVGLLLAYRFFFYPFFGASYIFNILVLIDVNNYKIYVLTTLAKEAKQIANSCINVLTTKVDHSCYLGYSGFSILLNYLRLLISIIIYSGLWINLHILSLYMCLYLCIIFLQIAMKWLGRKYLSCLNLTT